MAPSFLLNLKESRGHEYKARWWCAVGQAGDVGQWEVLVGQRMLVASWLYDQPNCDTILSFPMGFFLFYSTKWGQLQLIPIFFGCLQF